MHATGNRKVDKNVLKGQHVSEKFYHFATSPTQQPDTKIHALLKASLTHFGGKACDLKKKTMSKK